tara:strand:+ start:286 stop:795 length:510 start_codon:yes stop_codon:yes gene_type:complete
MRIFIEEYNTEWAKDFSILKAKLTKKLLSKKTIEIEHIGSTSVINLASKPVIDVLIGVPKDNLDNFIKPITDLGFFYVKEYEKEIPNRRFFYKNKNNKRIAHIHLVKSSSLWFRRHIAFRNELRENSKTKIEYEKLKKTLAKKEWKDGNEYADAKTDFIRSVEKKLKLY